MTFNREGSWFQVVLIEIGTGHLVGDVGIHFVGDAQVELGCTLKKEAQGMGYAREALTGIARAMFEVYGKHRIYVSMDPDNHKAIRLVEHLGFRKEAHHKKSYFFRGEWWMMSFMPCCGRSGVECDMVLCCLKPNDFSCLMSS